MSAINAVRNPQGIFINTQCFREEATAFAKNGYYTPEPTESLGWIEYWEEQERRCVNGYSVGGVHITGHHYHYLNFNQIQLTTGKGQGLTEQVVKRRKAQKKSLFPDFWDGDYNYYHSLNIAEYGCTEQQYKDLGLVVSIDPKYLTGGYHMIVGKARRKGYQQPHSEIIITPNGLSTMGDVKVGDIISTPTGMSTVLEKYNHGLSDVYELTLQDGRTVKCGKEHLWKIQEFRGYQKVVNTEFFLDKKLKRGSKGKEYYSYYLPQTNAVEYSIKQDLPINPYLLGLLIGDGSTNRSSCLFSTIDEELVDNIRNVLPEGYLIKRKANDCQYIITYELEKNKNPLLDNIRKLGLGCIAKHKIIPDIYKYASIEDRYELIKGLMDSDGSSWSKGSCNFVNTSEQLIDDLQFVLRSLGIRVKKSKCKNLEYQGFSVNQAWMLIITTNKSIFKLTRKLTHIRNRKCDLNKIAIVSVKKLDYQEESSCILIDSKEHLYLTRDFVVTHNSYKNSAICANIYNTVTDSTVVIGAYLKSYLYPDGTMGKASECLEFLNTHTGWAKARQFVSRPEHKKASYREVTSEGIEVERGFRSQIIAVTFQNNVDAARGKDGKLILFEEAGKFDNLKASYLATKDTLEDGIYTTGMMVIFGTGGDMKGGTVDFAEMFMNPLTYDLMPFMNIWDEKADRTMCGYFHPDSMNLIGCYDEQGNSDTKKAENFEESKRDQLRRQANSSTALQQRKQEHANNPSDAFLTVSTNDFPVIELNRRLQYLRQENLHLKLGQPGTLYQDETGKAKFKLDLEDKNKPLWDYDIKETDHTGSVVIFEYPVTDAPAGLYKIGHDPYRHDTASTSVSLGATYVYKGIMQGSVTRNIIVASYIGRPSTSNDYNRNLMLLAELYNAQIGYENEVTEVKSYFEKKNKLHLLAVQPDHVIKANIKDSNVARVFGIHMPEKLKDAGEKYIKQWLLTERDFDENGNKILNLDTIPDPGLLEEFIKYNRKGNFDRVMAFMILMMFIEEEAEGYEHKKVVNANVDYFNLNKKLFRR